MRKSRNTIDGLTELTAQITTIKKQVEKLVSEKLHLKFLELFDKYPNLVSFSWTQYAPYFNDGEACTFGVNADDIPAEFTEDSGDIIDFYDRDSGEKYNYTTKSYAKTGDADINYDAHKYVSEFVSEVVYSIPSDILENTYGSDNRITVTRSGIESDDYCEHD